MGLVSNSSLLYLFQFRWIVDLIKDMVLPHIHETITFLRHSRDYDHFNDLPITITFLIKSVYYLVPLLHRLTT